MNVDEIKSIPSEIRGRTEDEKFKESEDQKIRGSEDQRIKGLASTGFIISLYH